MPPKRKASRGVAEAVQKAKTTKSDATVDSISKKVLAAISSRIDQLVADAVGNSLAALGTMTASSTTVTRDETPTPASNLHQANMEENSPFTLADTHFAAALGQASTSFTGDVQQSSFVSVSIPVISQIPLKTKQSVWAGEYVDLHHLLAPASETEAYRLHVDEQAGNPAIRLVPQPRTAPLTIAQWTKAWGRYVAVLTEARHEQGLTAKLTHHAEVVTSLADKKAFWRYYDEQFRHLVARGEAQWGSTHLELYTRAVLDSFQPRQTGVPQPNTSSAHRGRSQARPPAGACFRYHTTGRCPVGNTCEYQHKCYNCLKLHPFSQCTTPIGPVRILSRYQTQSHQPFRNSLRSRNGPEHHRPATNTGIRAPREGFGNHFTH
jgi:hypothetical protein